MGRRLVLYASLLRSKPKMQRCEPARDVGKGRVEKSGSGGGSEGEGEGRERRGAVTRYGTTFTRISNF